MRTTTVHPSVGNEEQSSSITPAVVVDVDVDVDLD